MAALLLALTVVARPCGAITGTLTPAYGAPLAVQTTQTTLDASSGNTSEFALGEELDAAYAYVAGGELHLFLSGNMAKWIQLEGYIPHAMPVDVFLDTRPGGQNQLLPNNPSIAVGGDAPITGLTGLRFEPGFEADWWFGLGGNLQNPSYVAAYQGELLTNGGGAGAFLGLGACGGDGTLSGGTNPFGIQATIDDRNVAGVSQGCGGASGAGVTSGMEWVIPLAAIGNPTDCIRMVAFTANQTRDWLFNQVLGPLPAGTCNLNMASGVDFGAIPGDQSFTICPSATPIHGTTWGTLKSRYR